MKSWFRLDAQFFSILIMWAITIMFTVFFCLSTDMGETSLPKLLNSSHIDKVVAKGHYQTFPMLCLIISLFVILSHAATSLFRQLSFNNYNAAQVNDEEGDGVWGQEDDLTSVSSDYGTPVYTYARSLFEYQYGIEGVVMYLLGMAGASLAAVHASDAWYCITGWILGGIILYYGATMLLSKYWSVFALATTTSSVLPFDRYFCFFASTIWGISGLFFVYIGLSVFSRGPVWFFSLLIVLLIIELFIDIPGSPNLSTIIFIFIINFGGFHYQFMTSFFVDYSEGQIVLILADFAAIFALLIKLIKYINYTNNGNVIDCYKRCCCPKYYRRLAMESSISSSGEYINLDDDERVIYSNVIPKRSLKTIVEEKIDDIENKKTNINESTTLSFKSVDLA